jgi:hypothetical protein
MKALLYVTAILGLVAWAILGAPRTPTSAMPTFAQAYGVDCGTCHTFVPALNAYGRYIQRTAYSTLNPEAMKRVIPVWIGWNTSYDTQDPASPHQVKAGNVALHAAGTFGSASDFTYHAHQWVVQTEQPGGVDTLWVTYNNLLHRNGHLFAGKIESPGPSPFSQWFDVSSFATPALTVGEHTWQNDANRWGAKFAYVHNVVNVEFGYLGSDQDLNGVTDFIPQNGKTFQWRVAYAQPTKPVEIGLYGNVGRSHSPKGVSTGTRRLRRTGKSIRTTRFPASSRSISAAKTRTRGTDLVRRPARRTAWSSTSRCSGTGCSSDSAGR